MKITRDIRLPDIQTRSRRRLWCRSASHEDCCSNYRHEGCPKCSGGSRDNHLHPAECPSAPVAESPPGRAALACCKQRPDHKTQAEKTRGPLRPNLLAPTNPHQRMAGNYGVDADREPNCGEYVNTIASSAGGGGSSPMSHPKPPTIGPQWIASGITTLPPASPCSPGPHQQEADPSEESQRKHLKDHVPGQARVVRAGWIAQEPRPRDEHAEPDQRHRQGDQRKGNRTTRNPSPHDD